MHTDYSKSGCTVDNLPWIRKTVPLHFRRRRGISIHPFSENRINCALSHGPDCFLFIGKYAAIVNHYSRFYSLLPVGLISTHTYITCPASASVRWYSSVPSLYHVASLLLTYMHLPLLLYFGLKGEIQRNFETVISSIRGTILCFCLYFYFILLYLFHFQVTN